MLRKILLASVCFGLVACSTSETGSTSGQQEAVYPYGMVTAANPDAVKAGVRVLEAGGNAVDAAIAVHSVLSLVEPESSGIGGGGFMVVYTKADDKLTVIDGRETAPQAADSHLFYENGQVLGFVPAWQSGRSIGVPGQVALYEKAHEMFGTVSWPSLFEDAIRLGDDGFEVTDKLAETLASPRLRAVINLDDNPVTAAYFYPNGQPLAAGAMRDNPDFADTMRKIASEGAKVFYSGEIAQNIVDAATSAPLGSSMTLADVTGYKVKVRDAVCGEALDHRICSAPPPSSGGIAMNEITGLYERMVADLPKEEHQGRLKAWVDAQRLGYADRDHYVGDADFVEVPTYDLFDPVYLDHRVNDRFAPNAKAYPGDPGAVLHKTPIIDRWGRDPGNDAPGTTHLSVVDKWGNAVSMTATVESAFGSSVWTNGFLLNNQLTDFAREGEKNGKPLANAPAGGKRPRSSMSPSIVFDKDGKLAMVTGSPGGNSIIAYVTKTLVSVLDWGYTAEQAVDLPNVIARGDTVGVESNRGEHGAKIFEVLNGMGYNVQEGQGEGSGIHLIIIHEDGTMDGAADPRRAGIVLTAE